MATSAPLVWDKTGEKIYETGVSNVALYVQVNGTYPKGVAWNGVTAITESPSGAESNPIYADNIKYGNLLSAEELGATIEAYNRRNNRSAEEIVIRSFMEVTHW